MSGEEKVWAIFFVVAGLLLATVIVGSFLYNYHENEQILKADTCQKAMMIDGNAYDAKLLLCKE